MYIVVRFGMHKLVEDKGYIKEYLFRFIAALISSLFSSPGSRRPTPPKEFHKKLHSLLCVER